MGNVLGSLIRAVFPPRPGSYVWTVAPYRSSDPFLKVGVLQGPGVNERCLRNMSGGCTWLTCPAPSLSGTVPRRSAGV